ncbi:hypothetical protein RRG08_033368 [Elysia crispata]|uniref:Uncharacterized protein n=1 Tax=Elysia crispata TaxID=231223 RepID=A0AAE0Z8I2_9GAST|nr:hypothetical protein RRG08_033368 [Elysia crispata]
MAAIMMEMVGIHSNNEGMMTAMMTVAGVREWLGYGSGWGTGVVGVREWVGYGSGWGTGVVGVREWLGYGSGWGTAVAGVRQWLGYGSGWGTGVVGVRQWLGYGSGWGTAVAGVREWLGYGSGDESVSGWAGQPQPEAGTPGGAALFKTADFPKTLVWETGFERKMTENEGEAGGEKGEMHQRERDWKRVTSPFPVIEVDARGN